ncbi:MAG: glycoside hydrolase family 2 TIM barrel-domain containing protein [Candidatus Omnitrophota bacterium]
MINKKFYLFFLIILNSIFFDFKALALPEASFKLYDPGTEIIVDYEKYGQFKDIGKEGYKYKIKDPKALSDAVGEGIFPNNKSLPKDPEFNKYKKNKKLNGSHWAYVNSPDNQANFYRWAIAAEDPGVKLFYTAQALEKAGQIKQAIKAYYAVIVHFPKSVGLTYWGTPWYVGPAVLDQVLYLTRKYPELGIKLIDAKITIKNCFDDDLRNDLFFVNPGKLIKCNSNEVIDAPVDLTKLEITQKKDFGVVSLMRYENGHWQMQVEGKPFMIKAVAYQPSKIGQSPDIGTLQDWSLSDENNNGKIDSPYDSWVDKNRNNIQEGDEPAVGDFQIMKDLGVNVVRVYHHAFVQNKKIFQELYENYGIRIIIGDFLGMYAVGSKAAWNPGTNYSDPLQQSNMIDSVMQMINNYKDEPCVLMWVLGNENNYGTANNSDEDPTSYYHFVNEVAKKIKEVDPHHPVALSNGDIHFLDIFAKECPDIDILGVNSYRGKQGFGYYNFWLSIAKVADKPAMITEYGCPSYGHGYSREYSENFQAEYLVGNWQDMVINSAGFGAGVAIGGALFEFLDEWWKTGAPPGYPDIIQDVTANCGGPFIDGWYYEEWFGIVSQGDGTDSPFMRQLKKAYYQLQKAWQQTP